MSRGPDKQVLSYKSYIVNGFKFHTNDRESCLKTQNSGVVVWGDMANLHYYGTLFDVVELQYMGGNRVVLFKCHWWDVHSKGRGIDVDKYGIVSINVKRQLTTNEPFVLACQAEQIFYVNDNTRPDWKIVIKTEPRDLYRMPCNKGDKNMDDYEAIQQSSIDVVQTVNHLLNNNVNDKRIVLNKNEVPMATIESHSVPKKRRKYKELFIFQ